MSAQATSGGRVVVALVRMETEAELGALLRLARGLAAEVEVAWLEDRRLEQAAALPFTRAVTRYGRLVSFEVEEVRRGLRLFAARLERRVRELAAGTVGCRLVTRTATATLRLAGPRDVLVLTSADLRAVAEAFGAEVLTRDGPVVVPLSETGPVVAVTAGDPRTLALVRRLADGDAGTVVLATDEEGVRAGLGEAVGRVRLETAAGDVLNRRLADLIQRGVRLAVADPALVPVLMAALDAVAGAGGAGDAASPETRER